MLFQSFTFLAFFLVVFMVYHLLLQGRTRAQNIFLLIASYFFYGYADWRMLPILWVATCVYYWLGIHIEKANERRASVLTTLSILLGVALLGYFKYLNFFVDSFATLFSRFGLSTHPHTIQVLVPLGISFFTFRLFSYVIEIHRGRMAASRNFVNFATYVAFFPSILAGPIDRPNAFLPQLDHHRSFDYSLAVDGMRQILWGLFKKVVVADNLSIYVDTVWESTVDMLSPSGSTLLLTMCLYFIQLYADFSGYSDMAIGIAKLLGIRLADNFRSPLFAVNISDFWQRWHISLTSWLTDYIFIPLHIKYREWGRFGAIVAILVTFLVSGIWHGANWTFVLWGIMHALLFIPLLLCQRRHKHTTNRLRDIPRMLCTFMLVALSLVLFRAPSVPDAWHYLSAMCDISLFSVPHIENITHFVITIVAILVMLLMEWHNRLPNRWWMYYALLLAIWWFAGQDVDFIYFQF